jgi:hypothetical protein
MTIEVRIKMITQDDKVEAIKSKVETYKDYVKLSADDSIRDVLDASRVYVDKYEKEEYGYVYDVVWIVYPHQQYDEKEGLNNRIGWPIGLVADILRYMRQNNKTVVDKDVMQYIYSLQDREIKKILRARYARELEELREKLNEKLKEKEQIEKTIEELTNKIREIEAKIS